MEIKTTYSADGARTDIIKFSSEENKAIDDAIMIIKNRCIEAGYPDDYKNWDDERFRLLGIMRFEGGVDAVLRFANTAEILPYKPNNAIRAYA